jgi:hypothetical protein
MSLYAALNGNDEREKAPATALEPAKLAAILRDETPSAWGCQLIALSDRGLIERRHPDMEYSAPDPHVKYQHRPYYRIVRPVPLVVTRHAALLEMLYERGCVESDTEVVAHATADQLLGRHVFGVLPLHLAACATKITEVELALAPEDRGVELDAARMRQIFRGLRTYVVQAV